MMVHYRVLPAFAEGHPQLRTLLGGEELLLTRVASAPDRRVDLTSAAADAFALVFQLKPLPAHLLRHGGAQVRIGAGPAHTVSALDMAGDVTARVDHAFDSLLLRVPRVALDIFADRAGRPRMQRLHVPGPAFSAVDPVIGGLSQTLVAAMASGSETPLFADHLLLSLLAHVAARYGDGRASPRLARGGLSPWQERRAKSMLDDGGGASQTLADVASACGVSVAHFSRAFKISAGVTPWAWHQARRVERAHVLLRDVTLPLTQVAAAAGFADQSHFTRAFTAQAGMSPGRWRRERGLN